MHITKTLRLIKVSIDFGLKDLFKSFFKTAKWNSDEKVWEIANTTANANKLDKFAVEIPAVEQELTALEEQEATITQIEKLKYETEALVDKIKVRRASLDGQMELAAKLVAVEKVLEATKAEAEKCAAQEHAVAQANTEVLADVLHAYTLNGKSVKAVIAMAATAFNKRDRETLDTCQSFLRKTFDTVKEKTGIEFVAILEVARANINRPDRDARWFKQDIFAPENVCI